MVNVRAITVPASLGVELVAMATRDDDLDGATWMALPWLHGCMAVAALFANCLSLGVIYGTIPRLTPRLQLLTSISFSDMLAAWAVMTPYFSYRCGDYHLKPSWAIILTRILYFTVVAYAMP